LIKPIRIKKKNWLVWFGFGSIRLKLKKPNWTQIRKYKKKKMSQIWKNWAKLNQTGIGRFEPVSIRFDLKKTNLIIFFKKSNQIESNHPTVVWTIFIGVWLRLFFKVFFHLKMYQNNIFLIFLKLFLKLGH
jgi:hypothetical protein